MQIPTGERPEGETGRGGSAAFGAPPLPAAGLPPARPSSLRGTPGSVLSRHGGGPNAVRSDSFRLGVTRGAGAARVPRMPSRFPRRGSQGMSRPLRQGCPSWPWGCPGARAFTALLTRLLSPYPDPGSRSLRRAPAGSGQWQRSSPRRR